MIKYRCYDVNKLLGELGGEFHLINKRTILAACEEGCDNEYINYSYITSIKDDIKKITEWSMFGTEVKVELSDNTSIDLYSSNTTIDGREPTFIDRNDFFSPRVEQQGDMIFPTREFDDWLLFNKISEEFLKSITMSIEVIGYYEFKDIYEPIIRNGEEWGITYGSKLRIREDELNEALAAIKDNETKVKILKVIRETGTLKYD